MRQRHHRRYSKRKYDAVFIANNETANILVSKRLTRLTEELLRYSEGVVSFIVMEQYFIVIQVFAKLVNLSLEKSDRDKPPQFNSN